MSDRDMEADYRAVLTPSPIQIVRSNLVQDDLLKNIDDEINAISNEKVASTYLPSADTDMSRESTPDLMNTSQVQDPMTQSMMLSEGFENQTAGLMDCLDPMQAQERDLVSPMSDRSVECVEGKLELKLETDGDSYDYRVQDDDDDYPVPAATKPESAEYDYGIADKTCPDEVAEKDGAKHDSDSDNDVEVNRADSRSSSSSEDEVGDVAEVVGTLSFSVAGDSSSTTTITTAGANNQQIPVVVVDDEDDLNEKLKHMSMDGSVMFESKNKDAADSIDDEDDKNRSDSDEEERELPEVSNSVDAIVAEEFSSNDDSEVDEKIDHLKEVEQLIPSVAVETMQISNVESNCSALDASIDDADEDDNKLEQECDAAKVDGFMSSSAETSHALESGLPTADSEPINILDSADKEGPVSIFDSAGINGQCTSEVKRFFT